MAEKAIARKSQLFFNSILPVVDTHEEVVKKKLKRGKFFFTYTSSIKIAAILFLVIGLALFFGISTCEDDDTPSWYPYLFPAATGTTLLLSILLYMIFAFGLSVANPGLWIKIDILVSFLFSIVTIICSAISMDACKKATSVQKIPQPLCLVGCSLLIVSCVAIFLLYRYKEEEGANNTNINVQNDLQKARVSIFA